MFIPKPKRDGLTIFIASALLIAGLSILFLIPVEALYELSGRMNLGAIYLGLEALFSELLARIMIASPLLMLAYIYFRKAYLIRFRKH